MESTDQRVEMRIYKNMDMNWVWDKQELIEGKEKVAGSQEREARVLKLQGCFWISKEVQGHFRKKNLITDGHFLPKFNYQLYLFYLLILIFFLETQLPAIFW